MKLLVRTNITDSTKSSSALAHSTRCIDLNSQHSDLYTPHDILLAFHRRPYIVLTFSQSSLLLLFFFPPFSSDFTQFLKAIQMQREIEKRQDNEADFLAAFVAMVRRTTITQSLSLPICPSLQLSTYVFTSRAHTFRRLCTM